MRIIIVSEPEKTRHEAAVVNALFAEGLELFHIRKPGCSKEEVRELLSGIDTAYHSGIILHQHHELAATFGIQRIHFPESERKRTSPEELGRLKEEGYILSTSIHSLNDLEKIGECFNYVFFGPVYESISKPGYKPKAGEETQVIVNKNRKTEVIAIGGISPERIEALEHANFDGVALLGAIWRGKEDPVTIFRKCRQHVSM